MNQRQIMNLNLNLNLTVTSCVNFAKLYCRWSETRWPMRLHKLTSVMPTFVFVCNFWVCEAARSCRAATGWRGVLARSAQQHFGRKRNPTMGKHCTRMVCGGARGGLDFAGARTQKIGRAHV